MKSQKYIFTGNTYNRKESLKNFGAKWNAAEKQWEATLEGCQIPNFEMYYGGEFESTEKQGVKHVVFN